MKTLGIDFGLVNFGLAISEGELTEPLVQFKIKNLQQAREKIKKICKEKQIEQIVLGLPEGKLKDTVIGFSRKLKQETKLPVFFQQEDFTSKEAVKKMISRNKPKKKRQEQDHLIAACLILQAYLDQVKKTS